MTHWFLGDHSTWLKFKKSNFGFALFDAKLFIEFNQQENLFVVDFTNKELVFEFFIWTLVTDCLHKSKIIILAEDLTNQKLSELFDFPIFYVASTCDLVQDVQQRKNSSEAEFKEVWSNRKFSSFDKFELALSNLFRQNQKSWTLILCIWHAFEENHIEKIQHLMTYLGYLSHQSLWQLFFNTWSQVKAGTITWTDLLNAPIGSFARFFLMNQWIMIHPTKLIENISLSSWLVYHNFFFPLQKYSQIRGVIKRFMEEASDQTLSDLKLSCLKKIVQHINVPDDFKLHLEYYSLIFLLNPSNVSIKKKLTSLLSRWNYPLSPQEVVLLKMLQIGHNQSELFKNYSSIVHFYEQVHRLSS